MYIKYFPQPTCYIFEAVLRRNVFSPTKISYIILSNLFFLFRQRVQYDKYFATDTYYTSTYKNTSPHFIIDADLFARRPGWRGETLTQFEGSHSPFQTAYRVKELYTALFYRRRLRNKI